jgi:predicted nuclease of restriction endonuclease-like (RecB) superfamily
MRAFYLGWEIVQSPSGRFELRAKLPGAEKLQTPSAISPTLLTADAFPLPWSHYVRLMTVPNPTARRFYEEEAVKGGWSVRQLDRQIGTQFFERLRGSDRKDALLAKAHAPVPGDQVTADELVRDPYVLEFLNLRDEYGECELEEAIVRHLEAFLLELGRGFTFVSRQQKVRIDAEWYKIDLLLFHRRLRCLVVIDLKIGKFTHADAGQMNLYLNYAREHLSEPGENPPVGLILCSQKSDTVVRYAMGGINARVFASKYLTDLPAEEELRAEVERTKRALAGRAGESPG